MNTKLYDEWYFKILDMFVNSVTSSPTKDIYFKPTIAYGKISHSHSECFCDDFILEDFEIDSFEWFSIPD